MREQEQAKKRGEAVHDRKATEKGRDRKEQTSRITTLIFKNDMKKGFIVVLQL